jgi:NADH-quinone oxidoreductase subunit L
MWWVALPLGAAIGGWAYAVSQQTTSHKNVIKESALRKTLYVVFLNKGYFDELYEAYIVQPTLRLAHWLWRVVDVRGIDAAIHTIASSSILLAQWLWKVIDIKGIDRMVVGIGQQSVGLGHWLWNVVDIRLLESNFGQVGKRADAAGQLLREIENRTIQHYLLVMVLWLVSAIALLYILV